MTISEKLGRVQSELRAPKDQYNSFGKYSYRSCESILEAVKPLLKEEGLTLTLSDDVQEVGGRVYVKATATASDAEGCSVSSTAYAREAKEKKGMDEAQVTGAASSYARKYALNGLFAIDDAKDADATNRHGKETPAKAPQSRSKAAKQKETAPSLEAAKQRLCAAEKAYAVAFGASADVIAKGVFKRPDATDENKANPEWYIAVAKEFEECTEGGRDER